jgi:hypothetical protein
MTRWSTIAALTGSLLVLGGPAMAQVEEYEGDGTHRVAFAVGAGLVEPGEEVETYLMASLRFRVGGRDDQRRQRPNEGVEAHIEPEIGYWENDKGASDLLAGVNLIGVVPFGNVDSFFGVGAGVHFVDGELLSTPEKDSATKIGANSQFGIDVYLSEAWSLFGAGRFDLVQDAQDDIQGKIYLGVRGRF